MSEKLGLTGIDALEAEMRDRLAEANKAHEKTRAYLGAEINSKAELRNRFDIYVTEANRALGEKDATIEDLSRKLEASRHRVAELEARLEIDHYFTFAKDGGEEFVRVDLPPDQRDRFPDGIEARDATIKLQEEALARKDARIAELAAAVAGKVQLVESTPEAIAWAEGVFAAEGAKDARLAALEAALKQLVDLINLREWTLQGTPEEILEAFRRARSTLESKHPNAESLAAMQELEDGGGETFPSIDDLMKDLNSDD
jgi:hypothetical protein